MPTNVSTNNIAIESLQLLQQICDTTLHDTVETASSRTPASSVTNDYIDVDVVGANVEMTTSTTPYRDDNDDADAESSFIPDNMMHHPILIMNATDVSINSVSLKF